MNKICKNIIIMENLKFISIIVYVILWSNLCYAKDRPFYRQEQTNETISRKNVSVDTMCPSIFNMANKYYYNDKNYELLDKNTYLHLLLYNQKNEFDYVYYIKNPYFGENVTIIFSDLLCSYPMLVAGKEFCRASLYYTNSKKITYTHNILYWKRFLQVKAYGYLSKNGKLIDNNIDTDKTIYYSYFYKNRNNKLSFFGIFVEEKYNKNSNRILTRKFTFDEYGRFYPISVYNPNLLCLSANELE